MLYSFRRYQSHRVRQVLLDLFSKDFVSEERDGLDIVITALFRYKRALVLLVSCNSVAAVLEGGTLGLLGLAVSVLVGESGPRLPEITGSVGGQLNIYFESFNKEQLFIGLVVIAVTAQVIKAIMLYLGEAAQIHLAYGIRRNLQQMLTRHIVYMSYGAVSKYPAGTLANIVDQSSLVTDVSVQLGNVIRATLMGVAYVTMMVVISPSMALATLIITGVLWLSLSSVSRKLRYLAATATASQISLWRWTIEYLNSPRLLRLFNASEYAKALISKSRDSYLFPERKADLIVAAVPKILEIVTITAAAMFLIGGFLIYRDNAAAVVPALFVYVLIFFRLRPIIKAFNDFRLKVARIRPRLKVVSQLLSTPIESDRRGTYREFNGLKDGIVFESVCFHYPGEGKEVLSDINLNIPRGSTVALVGPAGAGKSTIIDLVLGLYIPSQGIIRVDGQDLREISLFDWRERIGVVDQEVFLLNTSILENIRFGRKDASLNSVKSAAKAAYADEFIVTMTDGYDTVIGERGLRLSGGQQQRIALARALLRDPDVLVLDEATSALDTESERVIQSTIETMRRDHTILIIAHRLSTVANSDFIVVVKDGRIIEYGGRDELLSGPSEFSRLWNLQTNSLDV